MKKNCLLLIFLYLALVNLQAQASYKYGAVDRKNRMVIPALYDRIESFDRGFATVTRKGKMGVVNLLGKEVIPCSYTNIKEINNNLAIVALGDKWGVINSRNQIMIPIENRFVGNYYGGTYMVVNKNYMFGVIDTVGQITVAFSQSIGAPYSGGKGYILKTQLHNNGQKIIDRHNKVIYSPKDGYAIRDFNNGFLGISQDTKPGRTKINSPETIVNYTIVDIDGRVINQALPIEYGQVFNQGLSRISRNDKIGVINLHGQQVIPCLYNGIYDFSDGYAQVRQDTLSMYKYGLVNDRGKLVVPCIYNALGGLKEDRRWALLNGKYGFLDTQGKNRIGFEYDYVEDFDNGYTIVAKENQYGAMNANGTIVIPLMYNRLKNIGGHYFIATQKLRVGIVDNKGNLRVPFVYQSINSLGEGYFAAQKDKRWGVIDAKGNEIIPFMYNEVTSYSEGLFVVQTQTKTTL